MSDIYPETFTNILPVNGQSKQTSNVVSVQIKWAAISIKYCLWFGKSHILLPQCFDQAQEKLYDLTSSVEKIEESA